jgi:hypothetical protein
METGWAPNESLSLQGIEPRFTYDSGTVNQNAESASSIAVEKASFNKIGIMTGHLVQVCSDSYNDSYNDSYKAQQTPACPMIARIAIMIATKHNRLRRVQ